MAPNFALNPLLKDRKPKVRLVQQASPGNNFSSLFFVLILIFSLLSGLYYGVSICLVSFASAMAVVTLNIHHRGLRGSRVPPWVRKIILGYLAKYVQKSHNTIYVTLLYTQKHFAFALQYTKNSLYYNSGPKSKKKKFASNKNIDQVIF